MVKPWEFPTDGFRPENWWFLIMAQSQVYFPNVERFRRVYDALPDLQEIETSIQQTGEANYLLPDYVIAVYPDVILVTIQGSTNLTQLLRQAIVLVLDFWTDGTGAVIPFYQQRATELFGLMEPYLAARMPRKVIFQGHSYGGALAQLIAQKFVLRFGREHFERVVTWGSPFVGDTHFARNYPLPLVNVHTERDAIANAPVRHTGLITSLPTPLVVVEFINRYELAGLRYIIRDDGAIEGEWSSNRDWLPLLSHVPDLTADPQFFGTHQPFFYAKGIRQKLPPDLSRASNFWGWRDLTIVDVVAKDIGLYWGEPFVVGPAVPR